MEGCGDEYVIERVLKRRIVKADKFHPTRVVEYFVKWVSWGDEFNEWLREDELYELVGREYERHVKEWERREKMRNKVRKYKNDSGTEKEETKWDEALRRLKEGTQKEFAFQLERERIEMEQEQIRRELADEARRTAQEAARWEREQEILKAAEERKELELKRKRQEAKRDRVLIELYKWVPPPQPQRLVSQPPPKQKKMRSRVPSLWNLCIAFICENLELYDGWENVPIMWKAKMFHYMSMKRMLSPNKFEALLDPLQKYLDLSICRTSVNESFFMALNKSPLLTSLTLTDCPTIYFPCLKYLKDCVMLEKLNLSRCIEISSLMGIEKCTNLKQLNLNGCYQLCSGNANAMDFLYALKDLSDLDISDIKSVPYTKIPEILQHLPNLTKLNADNSGEIITPLRKERGKEINKVSSGLLVSKGLLSFKWKLSTRCHTPHYLKPYREMLDFLLINQRHNLPILEELSISVTQDHLNILQNHPNLKHIYLYILPGHINNQISYFNDIKVHSLDEIQSDKLLSLDISFPPLRNNQHSFRNVLAQVYLSDKLLRAFVSTIHHIQVLRLTGMTKGSLFGLLLLWRNDSIHLRELDVSGWGSASADKNWMMWRHVDISPLQFPVKEELIKLSVARCYWFNSMTAIQCLISPQIMPNLEELDVSETFESNQQKISYLCQNFPNLHTLGTSSDYSGSVSIPEAPMIRNLKLFFEGAHPVFMWDKFLKNFSGLRSLHIVPSVQNLSLNVGVLLKAIRDEGRLLKVVYIQKVFLSASMVSQHLPEAKSLEILKLSRSLQELSTWEQIYSFQVLFTEDT